MGWYTNPFHQDTKLMEETLAIEGKKYASYRRNPAYDKYDDDQM